MEIKVPAGARNHVQATRTWHAMCPTFGMHKGRPEAHQTWPLCELNFDMDLDSKWPESLSKVPGSYGPPPDRS